MDIKKRLQTKLAYLNCMADESTPAGKPEQNSIPDSKLDKDLVYKKLVQRVAGIKKRAINIVNSENLLVIEIERTQKEMRKHNISEIDSLEANQYALDALGDFKA